MADRAVHLCDLELVLKVRYGAQPPDDHVCLSRRYVIYQKAAEGVNHHPLFILEHVADQADPFVDGKQVILLGIGGHRHQHLIENLQSSAYDVQMTIGNGIKGTGIDCDFLHSPSSVKNSSAVSP